MAGIFSQAQTVWINEIHYDNNGTDTGEGFEIAAPAGTDLSCYTIYLINQDGTIYGTYPLSGTMGDNGCGIGTQWTGLPVNGFQNGPNDGIALWNTCTNTLVQFLSYEGTTSCSSAPFTGQTSTDIGVSQSGSDPIGETLQLSGGPGQDYTDFTWQAPAPGTEGGTNTGQDFCLGCGGLAAEPTDEVSGNTESCVSCGGMNLDWTIGSDADNVIVVVSTSPITGTPTDGVNYNAGDNIAAGETVVYSGPASGATISGLNAGTDYYYAIFEYAGTQANCEENYLTGGVFAGPITTDANCSYIQSINYDACTSGSEGTDEIIVIQVGDEDVNVDDIVLEMPNSTWCNVGCGSNIIVNQAAYINDMNTMAGCALFVYCDPIPAGATLMIFTGNPPSTVIDYSGNCGGVGAPYCVIFLDNASTVGNYSNSTSDPKVTTISFGCGDSSSVTYVASDGTGTNGSTADFDSDGNVSYVTNVGCVYPLALTLRNFTASISEQGNELNWTSSFDRTITHFDIYRSNKGFDWELIGNVIADQEGASGYTYNFIDQNYLPDLNYYQLDIFNENGESKRSEIVSIQRKELDVFIQEDELHVFFSETPNKTYTLNIYSLSGKLVKSQSIVNGATIPWNLQGFYLVEISELELRQKVVSF